MSLRCCCCIGSCSLRLAAKPSSPGSTCCFHEAGGGSLQYPLLKEGVCIIISILNSSCVIRFCRRLLFFRQLRALWLCVWHLAVSPCDILEAFGSYRSEGMTWYDAVQVLVIWKYMQSNWEAKRLCEEDAKRFLSARYRPWQLEIGIS